MVNAYDFKLDIGALEQAGILQQSIVFDDHFHGDSDGWPDMLSTIFEGQHHLMHDAEPGAENYDQIERRNGAVRVPVEMYGELDDRRVQMQLKDLAYRVVEELSEATNCLKNKPWKDTFVETDKPHFYEELADALHFFVELLTVSGLTAEQVFELYFQKHAVNRFRQESRY